MNTRSRRNPSHEGTQRYFWTRYHPDTPERRSTRWCVLDSWTGQPHSYHSRMLDAQRETHRLNTAPAIERIGA